jgi:hypothetical protein
MDKQFVQSLKRKFQITSVSEYKCISILGNNASHVVFRYGLRTELHASAMSGHLSHNVFGTFAKLRKAIITFVTSICPPEWNNSRSHWAGFHEISSLILFRKFVENIQVTLQPGKNNGYSTWRTLYLLIRPWSILIVWNVSSYHQPSKY